MSQKPSNSAQGRKLFLSKELEKQHNDLDLFEEVFYQFPDMIHSVDDNGMIIAFNEKATEILGYTTEELYGKSIFSIYAPEVRDELQKGFLELKKLGSKKNITSKIITKSGEIIDVEVRSLSLYDSKGDFVKSLTITRDIREIKTLRESLTQQNKLAAIGELSSGIMHDIRNPLAIIIAYNDAILENAKEEKNDHIEEYSHKINHASLRIERLTNHLHKFVRSEADLPTSFKIGDLIDECLMIMESRLKQVRATVKNNAHDYPQTLIGRPNRLEQVFINLISNAADACKNMQHGTCEIAIKVETDEQAIKISIIDNGQGIATAHLKTIFDAFFTTKSKGEGTGLGLSICKGIVVNQGGKISVTSSEGKGTTFTVSLPWDCHFPLK